MNAAAAGDRETSRAAGSAALDLLEADLVRRTADGDEGAWAEIVRDHLPSVLAVCRRMLPGEGEAQAAARSALEGACESIRLVRVTAPLGSWLRSLAATAALSSLRGGSRREEPIEPLLPRFDETGHRVDDPHALRPAARIPAGRSVGDEVRAALARLPFAHRAALLLRDVAELDEAEAAQTLDLAPDLLRRRLHEARQGLCALLQARGLVA